NLQGGFGGAMVRIKLVGKIIRNLLHIQIKNSMYARFKPRQVTNFKTNFQMFHRICTGQNESDSKFSAISLF
ncbi:PIPO, partial [Wild tomato mosaic virus]|uniref:PIPO n=1 Tax=Wild tomato mosaic virus TaxID=400396 RepID=UPI000265156F